MPKIPLEVLTEQLREHHAFQAWSHVQSNALAPSSIEVLQGRKNAAVFRLNGVGPDGAIIAKRCRHTTGAVERVIYAELLPHVAARSLRCHGFMREPDGEFCWLFLEDARNGPYSPDVAEHRALAGSWLGRMHLATIPTQLKAQLPDRDLGHYRNLLQHCRTALLEHMACTPLTDQHVTVFLDIVRFCDGLEAEWSRIEKICRVMPRALVHGDFASKNVRVQNGAAVATLLVFDWQYAGWGIPATDLAQLTRHVVSPDLTHYHSVLARQHPQLVLADIERVAICGDSLRLLDEVGWAVLGLRHGNPRASSGAVFKLEAFQQRVLEIGLRLQELR